MEHLNQDHVGFLFKNSTLYKNIFIPKYYNPEIEERLRVLSKTHNLISISDLIRDNHLSVATGDEIGKMAYGTGYIPFIRTSDIGNWEIRTDPKHGVSESIYASFAEKQDVKEGDLFFVRDGTYLIGQSCMVTKHDLPCLYQSHILKFRVADSSPIPAFLLLACLNAPIVKQQIRAKQFTADIIDTVGNRFEEIILPVPKSDSIATGITKEVQTNISNRVALRENIRKIPLWAEGFIKNIDEPLPAEWSWRGEQIGNPGFISAVSIIKSNIFIPKYYDPQIDDDLSHLAGSHELISLTNLVKNGTLLWDTGIEIGKMAYGTGNIPFIRTSDISNWELKGDPKQNVSEEIYEKNKQDVQTEDIFVVRDGTYLVGTSCILTEHDTKILYCGGIYKIRVDDKTKLDPYLLLALLNAPIVRRQMRAKQFTRDIIDTLGKRFFEVVLPIPRDAEIKKRIAEETRRIVETRVKLRNRAKELAIEVEGIEKPTDEILEALNEL